MNITTVKRSFPLHFSRYASTDLTSVRIDQRLLSALIRAPARVRSCEIQALCSSGTTKQPRYHARSLRSPRIFLFVWTYYCLSDPLSTRLHGHCITWEIRLHTVHHPLSSSLFQPYSFTSRTPAFTGALRPLRPLLHSRRLSLLFSSSFSLKSCNSEVQSLFTN